MCSSRSTASLTPSRSTQQHRRLRARTCARSRRPRTACTNAAYVTSPVTSSRVVLPTPGGWSCASVTSVPTACTDPHARRSDDEPGAPAAGIHKSTEKAGRFVRFRARFASGSGQSGRTATPDGPSGSYPGGRYRASDVLVPTARGRRAPPRRPGHGPAPATSTAPADVVWPWVEQLGKGRAGWYLPRTGRAVRAPPRDGPPAGSRTAGSASRSATRSPTGARATRRSRCSRSSGRTTSSTGPSGPAARAAACSGRRCG